MQYIAYPLALLIIAVFFMVMFRPQIIALIPRIRKLGPSGFEAAEPPQQIASESRDTAAEGTKNLPPGSETFDEFQKAIAQFRFAGMEQKVEELKKSINIESLSHEQLKTMMADVGALILIAIEFESIYNLIYGSQIRLLQDLNTVFGVGRPIAFVREVYNDAVKNASDIYREYPFEKWLEFLSGHNLITVATFCATWPRLGNRHSNYTEKCLEVISPGGWD
jgi:hypothetical protein